MTLNQREKWLVVAVVSTLIVSGVVLIKHRQKTRILRMQAEVDSLQSKMKMLEDTLNVSPKQASNQPFTIAMLETTSHLSPEVKVIRMDRTSTLSFKLTLSGSFFEMMRFLSFLESSESKVTVASVELEAEKELNTMVQGIFTMNQKS